MFKVQYIFHIVMGPSLSYLLGHFLLTPLDSDVFNLNTSEIVSPHNRCTLHMENSGKCKRKRDKDV